MPRRCGICRHPGRDQIDADLLRAIPFKTLAERYQVSTGALFRHGRAHVGERLRKAFEEGEASKARSLLSQIEELVGRGRDILNKAEAAREYRTALGAMRELRGLFELLAKNTGELRSAQIQGLVIADYDEATLISMAEMFIARRRKTE
jgi:hypothetical protein